MFERVKSCLSYIPTPTFSLPYLYQSHIVHSPVVENETDLYIMSQVAIENQSDWFLLAIKEDKILFP